MSTEPIQSRSGNENARDEALREAGRNRTATAIAKTEKGIRQLIKDGGTISFSSVARTAGVSTKFLHQNEELATRIRHLAAQQKGTPTRHPETQPTGESAIIAALRRQLHDQEQRHRNQIRDLKKQINELEEKNQVLYGKLTKQGII